MNPLRYVGTDEVLTTEQGLALKESAVMAARRVFVGRKLFGSSIRKIDSGAQTYGYDTLTEVSAASLDFNWPGRLSLDDISLARTTVALPNLHKEFEINKLDLAASRMSQTPLNTSTSDSNAYKVAMLEDSTIILGYTADGSTFEINGLYNAAGNSEASSLDWAGNSYANIVTSINNSKALLRADNILEPYNLVIHPDQAAQADTLISNTAVSYRDWIEKQLRGGEVFVTPAITAGTGMMLAANPNGMFEYVVAEDFTTQTGITSVKDGENLFGRHYIRGLPVVYDSNAICKMTTI
jgi:uncharacterized linocin/CFP29 family protein